YWRDWNWWGFGPGAHSHIGRARWWNVKHPRAWAGRLRSAQSPAAAGEILDDQTRYLERVLLRVRTSDGIALGDVAAHAGRENASQTCHRLRDEGLLDSEALERGHIALTLRGRLLADYVTRELTD
ncbi:MAG: coproporphyrinogen III oxidase, partial [Actinomyces sp.]|nr:coproporphyrinogen III oxidase [Actinomyces sp.]